LEFADIERQFTGPFGNLAVESLVFLNNISRLEFWRRGVAQYHPFELYWGVCVESEEEGTEADSQPNSPLENLLSKEMTISYSKPRSSAKVTTFKWTIVSGSIRRDALPSTTPLAEKMTTGQLLTEQTRHAIPDVAMAACLGPSSLKTGHYYNSLPTPAPTGLPVHCHARFSTTADRRSLRVDGDSGEWNRFLAAQCFPHMYFFLLERLALRRGLVYYSFWPTSRLKDTITSALQSEFWKKIPSCPKSVIRTSDNNVHRLDSIVFDTREKKEGNSSVDPVLQFVRLMLPELQVVQQPLLNRALFTSDLIDAKDLNPNLRSLTPLLVRQLLQRPTSVAFLASFDDSALGIIIDFTLDDGPSDNLVGCYGMRTTSGSFLKLERLETSAIGKVVNVIDDTGFRLFKETHSNSLLNPYLLSRKAWTILGEDQSLNVRRFTGPDIDRFVEQMFPSCDIQELPAEQKQWLESFWDYIFAKKFQVSFYKTRPTLPLQPLSRLHFASLNGLERQPVMPPQTPQDLRGLCLKIPGLFIMEPSKLEDVTAITRKWDCEERFLCCLRRLADGELHRLPEILRNCLNVFDLHVNFPVSHFLKV